MEYNKYLKLVTKEKLNCSIEFTKAKIKDNHLYLYNLNGYPFFEMLLENFNIFYNDSFVYEEYGIKNIFFELREVEE